MKDILESTSCLKEAEIKRYISEQSSKEELHRIEDHILDCPLCSDAIEGLEQYYSFDTEDDLDDLKAAIGQVAIEEKETKVISMSRRGNRFTFNRIAAAILLLVVPASAWFYMSNNATSTSTDFGNSTTLRSSGEGTEAESELSKVIALYEAEQYDASLAASQAMLENKKEDVKTTYYAGLSAWKAEEYKLAIEYFITVRMNSDFYYEEATWLEIQSRIRAKDTAHAKLMLDELISRNKSRYVNEATMLRKTLD